MLNISVIRCGVFLTVVKVFQSHSRVNVKRNVNEGPLKIAFYIIICISLSCATFMSGEF